MASYLEPDQIHLIIEALPTVSRHVERDMLMLETLWQSGSRVTEVATLLPERIGMSSLILQNLKQSKRIKDENGKYFRIHDPSATKEVEVSGDLCNRLKNYCKKHDIQPGQWVFPSNRSKSEHIKRGYVWDIINKSSENAMIFTFGKKHPKTGGKFKGAYPHLFRHSCAVHLLDSTDNIELVREHLGHAKITTTQGYAHVKTTKMKNSIRNVKW